MCPISRNAIHAKNVFKAVVWLWKKFDIPGVVSETVVRQYRWYGELPFQTYNDVDRTFYESIIIPLCADASQTAYATGR